jgi:transcription termination/antitermination protein NusA
MQLSLAIGKKGQNVRLAAKLMGWRIDIKSEEEKRNEVEAAMAAISGSGTPVSVLIDYGLAEFVVDKLLEAGSSTVEALADMTPEQLDAIPGMNSGVLEQIQIAVNGYFAQFEPQDETIEGEMEAAAGAEEAEAAPKGPMVLPGLPEEGAVEDDDDDVEIPLDDFDTMRKRSAPQQPAGDLDEADKDLSDDDLDGAEDRD